MIDMRRQLYAIWARLCAGSLDYIGGADPLPQPLTREEEAELLQKLPTDDGTVRSILIERNLRLVVFIARKFESSGVGLEDLISIGTIGLIKAVNTFDPEKKNKLATYASRCIENEMLMHRLISGRELSSVPSKSNKTAFLGILITSPPIVAHFSRMMQRRNAHTGSGGGYFYGIQT